MSDAPSLFRILLQVSDLSKAVPFYVELLNMRGRAIRGSRHYFDCGDVILAIMDPTPGGQSAKPIPDFVYLAVSNLEEYHGRATGLQCLSTDLVHGEPAGQICKRPWGERSFYVHDPFDNGLCFVDVKTVFSGRP